ncbi:Outer membrane adhesin like proteiin [Mesorhizobium plurifarium]|uniref:Outer membrane adhesin like proteiin n=1 Tax=Mesorhizobium plurifarium TaxID=69974 RepID=A0A090EZH7_MESPL|nr:Outer membrane adhesin like proteiin [Mesorhizobium plurifarium]
MSVAQQRRVNPYDPNLQRMLDRVSGKSDHTTEAGATKSGYANPGGEYGTTGYDHHGNYSSSTYSHSSPSSGSSSGGGSSSGSTSSSGSQSGSSSNGGRAGWAGRPVILDLDGNGLSINPLSSSSQFIDLDGDGYQHRTAWAGAGNGVLVLDADGDGKISRSSEFVFTEWDQTADSDLDALKSVFDTNHNGMLDSGDDRWADFKVMVNGQLVTLASLGIASINLTATGSGQNFADGSAITGTATYTKTDGTTGAVGDAVLASDSNGYIIKTTTVTNGDGSKTTTLGGYDKDGTLGFQNRITVSAGGLSTTTQFDDDGNGTYERSQTDVTTVTAGVRQRVVSDFNTDGSLAERTTTTTSADKTTVTTALDQDGDGITDQTQVFVKNADGSTTTTVSENSVNGTLLRKVATTASADGLTKIIQSDNTGYGVFDRTSTEATIVAGDGTRTKTVSDTSRSGALIDREQTVTSTDGRTRTVSHDLDGDGIYETRDVTAITAGTGGSTVTTISTYSSTNVLIGKTVATTSSDGLSKTVSTDSTGDGLGDLISSDVTVVGTGGSLAQTQQVKSRDGTLLSSTITSTSADRKTISISTDANGDGHGDIAKTIVIDGAGVTSSTVSQYNADGSLVGRTLAQTSADGLSLTSKVDIDGDGTYDTVVTDVTTTDASSNRTRTVTTKSANGALIGSSAVTTSADSLTQTEKDDIDGNGTIDRTIVTATVLGGDGSRTVTSTTTSATGAMLGKTEVKTSADRQTITTKIDADGDGNTDQSIVAVRNADGSTTQTITNTSASGVQIDQTVKTTSGNGFWSSVSHNIDGKVDDTFWDIADLNNDGSKTETLESFAHDGSLLTKTILNTSGNGLSVNSQTDADGNGVIERKSSDVTVLNADGSTTRTISSLAGSGALIGKTVTTASANGQAMTISSDLDGDGLFDLISSDVKLLGSNGSQSETQQVKARDGSLLSSSTTNTSADRKTVSVATDGDGDGHVDTVKTISVDNAGATTSTTNVYNPDGSLAGKTFDQVAANGLSRTSKVDIDGDGTYDTVVTDVTAIDSSGNRTRTVTTKSANGTFIGSSSVVTTANGLTETEKDDLNADGTVDRTIVTATALGGDGSRTVSSTTTSTSGGVLANTVVTTSADQKTVTTTIDANGDGHIDQTRVIVRNADGSTTQTVTDTSASGAQIDQTVTKTSANGLWTSVSHNIDGKVDDTFWDITEINNDGSRTEILEDFSKDGTLLNKRLVTTSGNGLSVTTQTDADGDGTFEVKSTDVTALNADGSTVRTVSALAGTGALIGKTITTASANGLTSTVQADLDGNGTIDRTSTATTTLGADGSKIDTWIVKNASNVQIALYQTVTSGDGNTVTTTRDVDGNGTIDDSSSTTLNANGSTTTVNRTYAAGALTSSATRTISANGLSSTLATDLDGNSTIDQSTTDVIVLNSDGSKTETITDLDAAGAVKDKTTVFTSANGLVKTTTWAAVGATTSRSKVDTTVLNADGSTTETVDYKKADGSLESRTIMTISANRLTTTLTQDYNGDGAVDLTTTTVTAADGSVTATTTGPDTTANALGTGAYTTSPSSTSKTTTVSANGLSSTTLYGATSVDYLPDLPSKRTTETTIANDGSTVQTIKAYEGTSLSEQTKTTTAGDGLSITKEWDLNGDGTYDRKETDVTVLSADASNVHTVNKFEGATQTSSFVTTTSANGLSVTTSLDLFGANPFSQDSTDITTVNADGSTTRTVTNTKADGSQLSKFITATSADGRTITTQEDIDGVVGIDRVTLDATRVLADGSVVETVQRSTPTGVLLDSTVTTTSGDRRLISISRDADGDGTVDQTEVTTKAVDGSVTTLITDYSGADHKLSTTKITTSADGLLTNTQWDFNADGTIDQTRRINIAKLGDGVTESKTRDGTGASDTFYNKTTTYTSDDGRSSWTGVDYDASGGGFDNTDSIITMADGSTVEGIHNRNVNVSHLIPGMIYWQATVPGNVIIRTSADGLTTNYWYDYGGTATSPVGLENPDVTHYEITAVAHVQIDGSVVTEITGRRLWDGPVTGKGILTVSADGMTTTLLKDADNNGTYEHKEVAVTRIDGSIQKIVTDYNSSGAVTQTVTTDVSADGQSTSVITANATTGTGTTSSVGVEFMSPGTTNDTITGSAGDDQINSGAGNDTINGGAGDDFIDGGIGADTMSGGAGNDTFVVDNASDTISEAASQGTDTVLSSVTYSISDSDVENLTLTGSAAINGTGNGSANILSGNSADNMLVGGGGNDTLYGYAGNDTLLGGDGDDTFVGGLGNDAENAEAGNDIYVFQRGDGSDGIGDFILDPWVGSADVSAAQALGVSASGIVNTWVGGYYWQTSSNSLLKLGAAGSDTLKLTGGITADDLSFAWTGVGHDNLVISIAGGPAGDSITIDQQAVAAGKIEKLQLDGMAAMSFFVAPASGAILYGGTGNDIMFGLAGNDWLSSDGGDDILYGGAGNDVLQAFDGNDKLVGGKGNDNIQGMDGSNEYVFRPGDGSDYLTDYTWPVTTAAADIAAANALGVNASGTVNTWIGGYYWQTASNSLLKASGSGTSTLTLQGGITLDNLSFAWTRNGEDLTIYTGGAGDGVTISEYKTAPGRIEKLAVDGMAPTSFAVATSAGATVSGTANADILFGLAGNEWFDAGAGDDILYGGDGNDVMNAGVGNDRLVGGKGNDILWGMGGNDQYVFRRGDGSDSIQDYNWPVTTLASDIAAASAIGVQAGGIVNTWVGGYYWQAASNSLLKATGSGSSTLVLQGGIKIDDLLLSWTGVQGEDLSINIAGGPGGDGVSISQQALAAGRVENLQFDGLGPLNFFVARTAGGTIVGSTQADIIFGLTGNETLNGDGGNDILVGGAGNDTLIGGAGNDQYRFRAGDGSDTIVESGSFTDNDELDFGTGIDANELWFAQQGNNLVISVLGTTDKVTVSNWFAGPGNVVETIKSGDGKVLNQSDVATLVAAMAGFDPATSPTGSGIQPNDPRLGDPAQTGTIAAAMQHTWMAA